MKIEVHEDIPVERPPTQFVLTLDEGEARYVRAALLTVNPSNEAKRLFDWTNDPVFYGLDDALMATGLDRGDLELIVSSGNKPEGADGDEETDGFDL